MPTRSTAGRLMHLHRLALESQVLLTDAWPGVFDERVITAIRTVQEAVERILSGQDIRYYPAPATSGSERRLDCSSDLARLSGGRNTRRRPQCPGDLSAPVRRRSLPDRARAGCRWRTRSIRRGDARRSIMADRRAGQAWPSTRQASIELIDYPFADMTITVEAGMTLAALRAILGQAKTTRAGRCTSRRPGDPGGNLRHQHQRPAPVCGGAAARSDHRRQLRHVRRRGGQGRGAGRQECRRLRFSQAPDRLDGDARHHHPIDAQGPSDSRGFGDRLGAVLESREPCRHARSAQHIRYAAGGPRAFERFGCKGRRARAGLADWSGHHCHRLSKTTWRSVRWQLDRLKIRAGSQRLSRYSKGPTQSRCGGTFTEFQAASVGPVSFVANLRPSSVASFVDGLDPERWSVQAHAGNGIVRAHAQGEWTLESMAREIEKHRRTAAGDGGNLILSRCPDRMEGASAGLGRAAARLGRSPNGSRPPSILMEP